jgi:plastocyanin
VESLQGLRSRVRLAAVASSAVACLAFAGVAESGSGDVVVADNEFQPATFTEPLNNGEFRWVWDDNVSEPHNVVHENRLFRSGSPTSSPAAEYGPIVLPAGKYLYLCEVHSGMTGDIRIIPSAAAPESGVVEITWAQTSDERVGNRWQVQFRRGEEGPWRTWKRNTENLGGGFGANDNPVNFNSNRTYQVRVKTKLRSNPDRQSRFSPPLSFGAIR